MSRLINASELAEVLGTSVEHVRRAARQGKLPARRLGPLGWMRFDLDEALAAMRPEVTQPQPLQQVGHGLPLA
jgi:excisionase family DNA binding protein